MQYNFLNIHYITAFNKVIDDSPNHGENSNESSSNIPTTNESEAGEKNMVTSSPG